MLKPEVKQAAKACLGECCTVIHNPDVQPIVPVLISANANPKENVSALDRLMGTTLRTAAARCRPNMSEVRLPPPKV